ncbi:MAG TPA: Yip1 family protein [Bacillaceae bacterium]
METVQTDEYGHNEKNERMQTWLTIWVYPKKTVRHVIEHKTMKYAIIIMLIAGIQQVLNMASTSNLGEHLSTPAIILTSILLGPFIGLITWLVASGIYYLVGKWLGGKGTMKEMKMAVAWTYIPMIWMMILWIPNLAFIGHEMFTKEIEPDLGKALMLMFTGCLEIALGIWMMVISARAIGEVHRFSSWKGLLAMVLPGLAIAVVLIPIIVVVVLLLYV